MKSDFIAILDFGSQYRDLIARRVREAHVYCEMFPHDIPAGKLKREGLKGIILSGGPASVYDAGAPKCDEKLFDLGVPILGICYGMQLGCSLLGGKVGKGTSGEYGWTPYQIVAEHELFQELPKEITVWMSHGDQVLELPKGARVLARTTGCPNAAVEQRQKRFLGLQFHPEVAHTEMGSTIISNFLFKVCGCAADWQMGSFIDLTVTEIQERVGKDGVVCGVSGGVDSWVVATLVHRAIGGQLHPVFVDNGLLREGEADEVRQQFAKHLGIKVHFVDASWRFLGALRGVTDPEEKRKIIGRLFIDVFQEAVEGIAEVRFLAQGTLYPDRVESTPVAGGPSATIKSHHNVGGLPETLELELLEPVRNLFKDEVRILARELGLPPEVSQRHPFPGPGLAVRLVGEITPARLKVLRAADRIVLEEIRRAGLYDRVWQAFAVFLSVSTVGVMGDQRTYENVMAVRVVESTDGMTADWARLPSEVLERVGTRIINEVAGINRVVYDISSKPPSTIEWE